MAGIRVHTITNSPTTVTKSTDTTGNFSNFVHDTIIVSIGWSFASTPSDVSINSVTDTAGNVYSVACAVTRSFDVVNAVYYCSDIKASASNAVSISLSAAVQEIDIRAIEYSGLATSGALDGSATTAGDSGTAASGNFTTTNANDMLYGTGYLANNFTAQEAGWTLDLDNGNYVESLNVSSAGTYNATATQNVGGDWVGQGCAFKLFVPVLNATATILPATVLTLGPRLLQKPVTAIAPQTVLTAGGQVFQNDIATFLPKTLFTLGAQLGLKDAVAIGSATLLTLASADIHSESAGINPGTLLMATTANAAGVSSNLNLGTSMVAALKSTHGSMSGINMALSGVFSPSGPHNASVTFNPATVISRASASEAIIIALLSAIDYVIGSGATASQHLSQITASTSAMDNFPPYSVRFGVQQNSPSINPDN